MAEINLANYKNEIMEKADSPFHVCPEIEMEKLDSAAALLLLKHSTNFDRKLVTQPASVTVSSSPYIPKIQITYRTSQGGKKRPTVEELNQRLTAEAAADLEALRNAVQNGGRLSSDAKPVTIYTNGNHHIANKPMSYVVVNSANLDSSLGVYSNPYSDSDSFNKQKPLSAPLTVLKRENLPTSMLNYRKIKPISSGSSGADEASSPSLPGDIFKLKTPNAEYLAKKDDEVAAGELVIVDDVRSQSVPLDGHSAMSSSDEDDETRYSTASSHQDGLAALQDYYLASSSPENSKNKLRFAHNSRSYHRKRLCEKTAPDYRVKRDKNNEAVKKSRAKTRAYQETLKSKFDELAEENRNLKRRLDMAERRAEIAERQKDYLQTVLQSLAGRTKEKVVA